MNDHRISEEHLNAFLDGELDTEDRDRVFEAINRDEHLRAETCELRTAREMLRHAYDTPDLARASRHQDGLFTWTRAIAAGVLLAVGASLGWVGHDQTASAQLQAMFWDEQSAFQNASIVQAANKQGHHKVLVHVNTSDLDELERALDTAEELLRTYAETEQVAKMEIVANSGGLDLLRAGHSPLQQRVRELQQRYMNLTFLACQTAMDRVKREQGIDVSKELLPGVEITPSALDQILERLKEGWVYIKV